MYPNVKFDFLGYCFRPRQVLRPSDRKVVGGFTPAVSSTALKAMRAAIRDLNIRRSTQVSLADIARKLNPLLRGWIAYYGRYTPSALSALFRYVNLRCDGSSSATRGTKFAPPALLKSWHEHALTSSCTGGSA